MSLPTAKQFSPREAAFKRALHEAVDAYFSTRSRHAPAAQWVKTGFWLTWVFALWGVLTFTSISGVLGVLISLAAGFGIAQVGFNVGHDAIHGSLSSRGWINALFARSFDVMGASSRMWAWAHNGVHHTFTNVPGTDHDLEPGFFLHLYRREKRGWLHRFQHLYAWPLYALTMVVWVFKKDFAQLLARGSRTTWRDWLDVCAGKALHFVFWLGIPLWVGKHAWWEVLVGYAAMLAITGFVAAVVFQLAHVVESLEFPAPDSNGVLADDFATHQLRTTANFAPGNALATFLTGGLNHQVEHHLFPKVAHLHYPALAPLVRRLAAEHGLPYHSNPTFLGALAAHGRQLHALGHTPTALEPAPVG